jgi:ssDNA-binding replication factor A large subunit
MTSETGNDSTTTEETNEIQIETLKPQMKNVTLCFKVVEKSETREVNSRHTGEMHQVVDAIVGDSTGIVSIPLWDDSIENIEVGKTYRLENGYTGFFRGNLQLKIGRDSIVKEAETEIEAVNRDVDMSAEIHHDPRERHYYQPMRAPRGYRDSYYSTRRDNDWRKRRDGYSRRRRRW